VSPALRRPSKDNFVRPGDGARYRACNSAIRLRATLVKCFPQIDAVNQNSQNCTPARSNNLLMKRAYYSSSIERFLDASLQEIIGSLTINSGFAVEPTQRDAWLEETSCFLLDVTRLIIGTWRSARLFGASNGPDIRIVGNHQV
jgi:hypothetical protein